MRWAILTFVAFFLPTGATGAGGTTARGGLTEYASANGFNPPVERADSVVLRSDARKLVFVPNRRGFFLDGLLVYLNGPIERHGNEFSIGAADVRTVLLPLLGRGGKHRVRREPPTIVIDPGHGGEDSGAVGHGGIYEKRIVMDIANRLSRQLQGCGAVVKLTREHDATVSLRERTGRVKALGADILVSIHLNAAGNTAASGIESYVLPAPGFPSTSGGFNGRRNCSGNRYDALAVRLAYFVHKGLLAHTRAADRGIRRARFEILRNAPCPAVLVECGFVSNAAEAGKLLRQDYRETLAKGLAGGVLTFLSRDIGSPEPAAGP